MDKFLPYAPITSLGVIVVFIVIMIFAIKGYRRRWKDKNRNSL